MIRRLLTILLVTAFVLSGCAVTAVEFVDTEGRLRTPLRCRAGGAAVLIFITTDCPIANGYAPQIQKMIAAYQDKPVDFYLVQVDPDVDVAKAREHAADYGYTCPILLDHRHVLVTVSGVTVTPEAALFTAGGRLRYRGRINNWYGDLGRKRFQPTRHELRDALDAVLTGEDVKVPRIEAVGCSIPSLQG